jgi:phage FluMu protein Com
MSGKCPKCENIVSSVVIDDVNVNAGTKSWRGITYQCPSCRTILGVGIDPIALKADTVREVLLGLRKTH